MVYDKGFRKTGNVEPYLGYKKLHRTGRLLRGLKVRRKQNGDSTDIELYNKTPYASEHELGGQTKPVKIKEPYVQGGASAVITGGDVEARPSMKPSKQVLRSPMKLVENKMRGFGW